MSEAVRLSKAWYERCGVAHMQDRNPNFYDRHLKTFADFFCDQHPDDGVVLDVGAAGAFLYPALKQFLPLCHYESGDLAQSFVQQAQETYPYLHHFECNIADRDTLPKKHYNGIICLAVLQHVAPEEILHATCNIYELLVPKGFALISLPTSHVPTYQGDTRHFTILDRASQRTLLQDAGFKIRIEDIIKGSKGGENWRVYLVQKT